MYSSARTKLALCHVMQEWQSDERSQAALAASIREATKLLFFKKLEVPVLAMFNKELMGELLCTRAREIPDVVSVSPLVLPSA